LQKLEQGQGSVVLGILGKGCQVLSFLISFMEMYWVCDCSTKNCKGS